MENFAISYRKMTENEVIEGVKNFLLEKGRTTGIIKFTANAEVKEHGIDLKVYKGTADGKRGNYYLIEAKGDLNSDGTDKKSQFLTEFRWAISQIILRIQYPSNRNNRIFGIAIPSYEKEKCVRLIHDNWALKELGIRLYTAYEKNGNLTADEYCSKDLYKIN